MKTNFDKLFKMDSALEKEGIWIEIGNGASFKARRIGGANSQAIKSIVASLTKPYQRQIELGTLDEKKEREILVKTFVKGCLVDWKGVEIDGAEVPYSEEKAIELFLELPELFKLISSEVDKADNFKAEVGNA